MVELPTQAHQFTLNAYASADTARSLNETSAFVAAFREDLQPITEEDSDADGVPDGEDNCMLVANSAQADSDADGCGDVCDTICDPDADGIVTIADVTGAAADFGSATQLNFDCNGNGMVDISDVTRLAGNIDLTTGPSGLDPALKQSGAPADGGNGLNCQ